MLGTKGVQVRVNHGWGPEMLQTAPIALLNTFLRGKARTIENSCRCFGGLSYGLLVVITRFTQRPRLSPRAVYVFLNLGGVNECFLSAVTARLNL